MTHVSSSAGSNDHGSDAGPGPASTPGASLARARSSSADTDTDTDTWLLCAAHFGTCVSWFLAPLVVWLWARASAPHVAARALAVLLWSALGTACAVATCGLAIPVFLVVHVWAGIKELRGEPFDYPFASDLARRLSR